MLYFPNGRPIIATEVPIAASSTIAAEGQALVADTTGGVFGAKPSAGSSSENFLGIAVSQQIDLATFPKVEEKVVPNTDAVTIARTPSSGTLSVYDVTTSTLLSVTTHYTVSGETVTMADSTYRGHTLRLNYKFAPTAIEARAIQGDVYPGGAAGTSIGQVGVFQMGIVYTTEYDSTKDWTAAGITVKTGANGQFTVGGSGTTVDCVVVAAPSSSNPYLGLFLK